MKDLKMKDRYSKSTILVHWLMLVLLVAVYCAMEFRDIFPKGTVGRNTMVTWHFMLGLSVFVLLWVRLIARFLGTTPTISPAPPVWQEKTAKGVIGLIYLLMFLLPLSGWLMLSAGGKTIPFFGLELPALMAPNHDIKEIIEEIHEILATAGYVLVGLHTAAALYHHHFLKDNTLKRMLRG